jgi:hypothetical protein
MALKIKPSAELTEFVKSIPENAEIPLNLTQLQLDEENVLLSNADLRWLGNYIQKVRSTVCKY